MQTPSLTCVFRVNIGLKGYLIIIFEGIEGLKFNISSGLDPEVPQHWLVSLRGTIDPVIFIKKLYIARSYVMLHRIDYGYEENPEGTRKPNSHLMRCQFQLNTLSWYKRIMGALRTNIQDLSFTIYAKPKTGYQMAYLCGNVEFEVLMKILEKMLEKTDIVLLVMRYGLASKLNLKYSNTRSLAVLEGSVK